MENQVENEMEVITHTIYIYMYILYIYMYIGLYRHMIKKGITW